MTDLQVASTRLRLAVFAFLCLTGVARADTPTKHALLIGIDDYQAVSDLHGCVNDVDLIREILIGKYDVPESNIATLKNEQATRANIIDGIRRHLVERVSAGDVAILHYSGHGSQSRDQEGGDEVDGWDETIVAHDSRTEGVFDLTDDEINGLLGELTARTKNVTFILDSCHSGAAARAGNRVRMVDPDPRAPPAQADFAVSSRDGEGDADFRQNGADYVLISGCLATELSNESQFDGRRHGAMTWFLGEALKAAGPDATYRSVMDSVGADVTSRFPSQHPQVEGPGMDLRLFGTDKILPRPYVLVKSVDGDVVRLNGGKVLGLQEDAVLRLYPPETADFDNADPVGSARVIAVEAFSAQARIVEGAPVTPGTKALIEFSAFGQAPTTLYIGAELPAALAGLDERLADHPALERVDSPADAMLLLEHQEDSITLRSGDLEQLASPLPVSTPNLGNRVVAMIGDVVHWRSLRDLRNPHSGLSVGFDFELKDNPGRGLNPAAVTPGQHLVYRVRNEEAETPLFVYVLDISSDGSVALLYPPPGEQQALSAGAVLEREIEMYLPPDIAQVTDVLKVIATTEPVDASVFPRGSLRASERATGSRANMDPLSQFLADATRGARAGRPVNVASWVTAERSVRIRPPEAITSGFALHFDQPVEAAALPTRLGAARDVCAQGESAENSGCLQLRAVDSTGTIYEMESPALSRSEQENRSIGAIFDEAYLIQEQTGAIRVEPNLEIEAPGLIDQQGIDKRELLGDSSHDAAAEADELWSLRQARVVEAWQKIRDRHGVAEGHEADGILVAHTDTGYLPHPENWEPVDGVRPIDPDRGYDYYDGDEDPLDPLLDSSKLDNPGHGTASGSVIVSPAGCQLENTPGCVNGLARGARLVPLRVHRTVSQINTSNLAQAIRDVAEGRIEGSPQLISTAMGGPPSFNLYRAVRSAEENGVLMVAAAGNYVRTVVWPARFHSTIAAAAVNVRCTPWQHSSRGDKVDISAPGESVWRATLNSEHEYINYMGKGTTFATGNTAAAAALWLSWHRDDPALAALRQEGRLTAAFREALAASAWRPTGGDTDPPDTVCSGESWDDDNFGPGIVDIAALLDVPLPAAGTRELAVMDEEQVPLFASLYPDGTPPERVHGDYRTLLGAADDVPLAELSGFETEIMHHYTLDDGVRRTIESLLASQRGDESTERARDALLSQDLSSKLRGQLRSSGSP